MFTNTRISFQPRCTVSLLYFEPFSVGLAADPAFTPATLVGGQPMLELFRHHAPIHGMGVSPGSGSFVFWLRRPVSPP
jgi:hypothetical protein